MTFGFVQRLGIGAVCLAGLLVVESADAQVVRGRVGIGRVGIGRIGVGRVIGVPIVPRVIPRPFVRPVVPLVRPVAPLVRPVVPYVAPRRRVAGAVAAGAAIAGGVARDYRGAQVYASSSAPIAAAAPVAEPVESPAAAPAEQSYPTDADLQSLDDGGLLNALVDMTSLLDEDLARFNTGAQWRTYLRLPDDAVPPPTNNQVVLGLSSLRKTLGRYDKIAAESAYRSINSLPSFVASRAALAEAVTRFGSRQAPPETPPQQLQQAPPKTPPQSPPLTPPQAQTPRSSGVVRASAQEELPSPSSSATPTPAAEAPSGERSILSR